jgi:thiamine biosynthesis protein ThiS
MAGGVKSMMQVTVNGENKEFPPETSVSELLKSFDTDERYVAVELNRRIVPRAQFSEKLLMENDILEIVTFVGGG